MAELRNYRIDKGNGMSTEVQLTPEDAERLGATEIGPAHDVQTGDEEPATPPAADDEAAKAARAVQNRARRTS